MQAHAWLPRRGSDAPHRPRAFESWAGPVLFSVAVLISVASPAPAQTAATGAGLLQPVPLLEQAPVQQLPHPGAAAESIWQLAPAPRFGAATVPPLQLPPRPRPWGSGSTQGSLFKNVLSDPTTYAPAVLAFTAMRLDWDSSQPFFRNGYQELNGRFTVNGVSGGPPLTYGAGNRKIAMDALWVLGMSALNNGSERLFERFLASRLPGHPKLVRVLGWAERTAFASWVAYSMSAGHFRQWQANERLAGQLGFK